MRVRFNGVDVNPGDTDRGQHSLTVGALYDVLEAYCLQNGQTLLRIDFDSREAPALYEAGLFEVVDARLPPSWTASISPDGYVRFAPEPWQEPSFWEAFFDGSDDAFTVYETEKARISHLYPRSEVAKGIRTTLPSRRIRGERCQRRLNLDPSATAENGPPRLMVVSRWSWWLRGRGRGLGP